MRFAEHKVMGKKLFAENEQEKEMPSTYRG
jgi:hypothetical protein